MWRNRPACFGGGKRQLDAQLGSLGDGSLDQIADGSLSGESAHGGGSMINAESLAYFGLNAGSAL